MAAVFQQTCQCTRHIATASAGIHTANIRNVCACAVCRNRDGVAATDPLAQHSQKRYEQQCSAAFGANATSAC